MVFDYVVTLRNTSKKAIDLMNRLLSIIAVFYILYRCIATDYLMGYKLKFAGFALAIIVSYFFYETRNGKKIRLWKTILLLAGILIVFNKKSELIEIIFGFGLMILAIIEDKAKSNLEIGFSPKYIMFDNLFKKKYNWSDFNNVILKDNLLTLDFKNNRIYQRETIDEESDCDEDEFNSFCREQLQLARNK